MSLSAAFDAVVGVAHSALQDLAVLLTPVAGGFAAALAIVALTVAVRLLISPLTYLQVRAERRRSALAPHLRALREKHRDDPLALVAESLALQRAAGAGPMVSLLPALAQAPFIMVMYRVATHGVLGGALFGVPLTAHLAAGLPVFAGLLALALLIATWSARRMRRVAPETPRWLTCLPFLTVPVVAFLPLAGGLYLVTSAAWSALEHAVWRRPVTAGDR